jgi:hypothetical protein
LLQTAALLVGLLGSCAMAAVPPAAASASAAPLVITAPLSEFAERPEARYFPQLLELALRRTQAEGPFEIRLFRPAMSAQRAVEEIKKGRGLVNLMWNGTSPQRERELLPVRVSLLRDLNSYRLLLIRKGDQKRFDEVRTVDDLKRLSAGLGMQWPDVDVLRANGIAVVTSDRHLNMFRMLEAKRFDYTPRGLYEIWSEAALPENRGLEIERSLMLHYDMPFYFFVGRNNPALAARIERGLKLALADGSFDALMNSVPNFKRGLDEQRSTRRRLIALPAPASAPVQ